MEWFIFWMKYISIHTPTQGVTNQRHLIPMSNLHFNPYSHAGSDALAQPNKEMYIAISIHTPTLGVTRHKNCNNPDWIYFNPHSHAGSDARVKEQPSLKNLFQSTLPRREWHVTISGVTKHINISIHTPTQGVTAINCRARVAHTYFNPHSHAGSDDTYISCLVSPVDFNPHSHAGSDAYL